MERHPVLGVLLLVLAIGVCAHDIFFGGAGRTDGSTGQITSVATAEASSSPAAIGLAECLTKKGIVLYSAWWCGPCKALHAQFGPEADAKLTVVQCSAKGEYGITTHCKRRGIRSVPSWGKMDGSLYDDERSFEKLAAWSGCAYAP